MTDSARCPVCGGNFIRSGAPAWVSKCDECGLLASSLEPAIPHEKSSTAIDERVRLEGLRATRMETNRKILAVLQKQLSGKRVLDVGCGHGIFLLDAVNSGFNAEGVEPDGNVVETARRHAGATVHHGFFPDVLPEGSEYDAIVFNDVMEHIPSVKSAVAASAKHLARNGILVLNCPDQRGVFYRLSSLLNTIGVSGPFKRMWQFGLPSPHVWYFTEHHLIRLGKDAGLVPIHVERVAPITLSGLWDRVSYVQGQSLLMNIATAVATIFLLPFLGALPKDTSIVFLRKE